MPDKFFNADVTVLQPFQVPTVKLAQAFKILQAKIPQNLLVYSGIDAITVGEIPFLDKINATSVIQDGGIYLSSKIATDRELVKALTHEYAHAIEERFADEIYADGSVEAEYVGKKRALKTRLEQGGYAVKHKSFDSTVYDQKMFDFFFVNVGYDKLTALTKDLFVETYGVSSLGEYFSTAFSVFFFDPARYEALRTIQPMIFNKLQVLASWTEQQEAEE